VRTVRIEFFVAVCMLVFSGCSNPTQGVSVTGGVDAGPINVAVSIDANGRVSVSGGFAPKIQVGLGPVGLELGIQKTLELTAQKPYYLFILWEDANGQVQRDEYEIGKKFNVVFAQGEHVRQIQGQSDSIIVVVEHQSSTPMVPVSAQSTPPSVHSVETTATRTQVPSPTTYPDTLPGTVLGVGQAWRQGGLEMVMDKSKWGYGTWADAGGGAFSFMLTNLEPHDRSFNVSSQNFAATDNRGRSIPLIPVQNLGNLGSCPPQTVRLAANDTIDLTESLMCPDRNGNLLMAFALTAKVDASDPSVTAVIISASASSISNARWKNPIYH
jgi:hypothetical protein